MAKMPSAVASDDQSDDDRCSHCGACKHCGHGGAQMAPQIIPMPYPVYPGSVAPAHPWGGPNYWPNIYGGQSGVLSSGTYTQTWNG